jgi:hypothetical protein
VFLLFSFYIASQFILGSFYTARKHVYEKNLFTSTKDKQLAALVYR